MAADAGDQPPSAVEGEMEGNGAGTGDEPKRKGELVLETRIAAVKAGQEEFAEAFEVAGREDWFGFHGDG